MLKSEFCVNIPDRLCVELLNWSVSNIVRGRDGIGGLQISWPWLEPKG
jgi:hypothetical protein